MEEFLSKCERAVLAGDKASAVELAEEAVRSGMPLLDVVEGGFVKGIRRVGRLWEEGTYFLPELVMGAEAVKGALSLLNPSLSGQRKIMSSKGVVVIGTVEGDIHDIGKTLVATMLSASGYRVVDIGADKTSGEFVDRAVEEEAYLIAASALLTTTMRSQQGIIEELVKRGARERFGVIVGGAPCSRDWAEKIGADGYAKSAVSGVDLVEGLITGRGGSGWPARGG